MELENIQVVEYSVSQGCYHLHSLADMLKDNNTGVIAGKSCDYVPIAFFKTDQEADKFIEWHRRKMKMIRSANKLAVKEKSKNIFVQLP